jgi:hypothetical protein
MSEAPESQVEAVTPSPLQEALLRLGWKAGMAPPSVEALNAHGLPDICSGSGARVEFIDASATGPDVPAYEVRAWRDGGIPTRAGSWHDAYNAAAWLAWPKAKRVLNDMHHQRLSLESPAPVRGTARDVLTLFDEDGLVVSCADPSLADLLREFCWKELFWSRREPVMASMRFHVFGHALADKLRAPFRGLTAKALIFAVEPGELRMPMSAQVALLDARLADHLRQPQALASTRVFSPLPVLGIPGWYAANADAVYYDDTWQFRPGRRARGVHSSA